MKVLQQNDDTQLPKGIKKKIVDSMNGRYNDPDMRVYRDCYLFESSIQGSSIH